MSEHTAEKGAGCYICQPDNPNAAEEGCGTCDREFWQAVISHHDRIFAAMNGGLCWGCGHSEEHPHYVIPPGSGAAHEDIT